MTTEKLRELWKAQPFRPFVIHLADGRELRVVHPEFLMVSPRGRTIVLDQPDEGLNIIDLEMVTDLELKPNGRPKAGKRRR